MSKRDRNRKGKARREAESIHKESEMMIKRLNKEGVVKRAYGRSYKAKNRNKAK